MAGSNKSTTPRRSSYGSVPTSPMSSSHNIADGPELNKALHSQAEDEPLLEAPPDANEAEGSYLLNDDQDSNELQASKSSAYLILLTVCMIGLQFAWSVELESISPYLLSLGLSKSLLSLVWIAGPLSGTLVQPYVGLRSDNCHSTWGRRRPFIVVGAACTMISLLLLSWTATIVEGVLSLFGLSSGSHATRVTSQVFAIILVYVLDFAVNIVQAAIRAFIVDCAPTHQQDSANAWANRMSGVGNIMGYLSGYVELTGILPFLGDTNFKILVAIACIVMIVTVGISCFAIKEHDLRELDQPAAAYNAGVFAFFQTLYVSVGRLPVQVKRVCQVQLFAWIGWFPFLFYTTTYISGVYANPFFAENPNMGEEAVEKILADGTRIGSFALFVFSITSFATSVVLPILVVPSYIPVESKESTLLTATGSNDSAYRQYHAGYAKASSLSNRGGKVRRLIDTCSLERLQISSLTLRRAWFLGHLMFAVLTWMTLLVDSTLKATILVGFVGIPWAVTNWAPFALISAEISKRDDESRHRIRRRSSTGMTDDKDTTVDQAGIVLGIHNVSVAAPQVVATVISSIIFKVLQKPRGSAGDTSIAWVLRFGGLCALAAAWRTRYVHNGDEVDESQPV